MLIWPEHPAFATPLSSLKGVGPKTLAKLEDEGCRTTGDLLARPPKFYQDRRHPSPIADLSPDQEALVEVRVVAAKARWSPKSRRRFLECKVEDDSGGSLILSWFNFQNWMPKSLGKGRRLRAFGRVRFGGRGPEMSHPDLDFPADEPLLADDSDLSGDLSSQPGIHPVYAPIGELSPGLVRKLLDQSLTFLADCPPLCPADWLAENQLYDPVAALSTLHAPPGNFSGAPPRPAQTRAFRHLALFELLFWRLMMLRARSASSAERPRSGWAKGLEMMRAFWAALPFPASPEQLRVSEELAADMKPARPMSRLLQGEVGGGKTAVAGAALFFALGRGGQGAIMAPTEVLARQHYDFLSRSAQSLGFEVVLLTGSLSALEKRAAREALTSGRAQLAVGSQALLSPTTVFKNLTMAVIDEQHRFGVRQRLALRRKSARVDLLAMSATPIPRSLTLMLYGDLDSSRLHGLLPGRSPARTVIFEAEQRQAALRRFLELVQETGQGFLVTPRIEAPDDNDDQTDEAPALPSLDELARDLGRLAGPELPLACLHGQLPPDERERVMEDFRAGRIKILVATSIIEVGVDVPAAGVILIVGAERFGLAQLHQLRGRVGRGGKQGHCLLLPVKLSPAGARRLLTLVKEHDGQVLAELDLEMRGPGEQLGLRQSGWPAMTYARLPQDLPLLDRANRLAEEIWNSRQADRWLEMWKKLNFDRVEDRLAAEFD